MNKFVKCSFRISASSALVYAADLKEKKKNQCDKVHPAVSSVVHNYFLVQTFRALHSS